MRLRFRWTALITLACLSFIMTSCSTGNSSSATSGTGYLWLTAQGNTTVQAYTISLSSGALSLNGSAIATGSTPVAILSTPKGDAAFVLNSGAGATAGGAGISAYTINSDGTLKSAGSVVPVADVSSPANTCANPRGLAIDPGGKFLFVACQGVFSDPTSGAVYAFSVSGATLSPIGFRMPTSGGALVGSGPVALAVSASGNYLYVANQFANNVASFQISSTGTLTQGLTYPVGISPSAVFISIAQGAAVPAGQYLYVANTGSNNISAFSSCDVANAFGCSTANGVLAPISGSPFPAQPGPVAIAMDPTASFLYAVDEQANQISEYSWSSGTGVLTPLNPAFVSAGGNPVALAIRSGIAATTSTAGTDYMYVANSNGSSLSVYTLNTTTGQLNVLGSPVTTPAQPSAVTVR